MASTAGGWPPSRYRDEGNGFVVRSMTVVHHRETFYGDALVGRSWVSRFRREMLSTRQVRIDDAAGGPVVTATQEWAHVTASLEPVRAPKSLAEAFPAEAGPEESRTSAVPAVHTAAASSSVRTTLEVWDVWMDPLGHVNHPVYVDMCDEALARSLRARGIEPARVVPVAEEVTFRGGVGPGDVVTIESEALGWEARGAALHRHKILVGDRHAATATTARTLFGESGPSTIIETR